MKHVLLFTLFLGCFFANAQSFTVEESGVFTIEAKGDFTFDVAELNKTIEDLQNQIKELKELISKLEGSRVDLGAISNDIALQLMVQHNQGLAKSRTTVQKAISEGLTTYDEIYKYSLEELNIKNEFRKR